MTREIAYPDLLLPRLRYRLCPMCASRLEMRDTPGDLLPRAACPACGWVHYPGNAVGVNLVIRHAGGIVAILPPGAPAEAPAALPGGHVEYGEPPEQAAVREAREETGLEAQVIRCLGWFFHSDAAYPGPMVSFIFEMRSLGGALHGSAEGRAAVFPLERFPAISPGRWGSTRAMQLFRSAVGEEPPQPVDGGTQ